MIFSEPHAAKVQTSESILRNHYGALSVPNARKENSTVSGFSDYIALTRYEQERPLLVPGSKSRKLHLHNNHTTITPFNISHFLTYICIHVCLLHQSRCFIRSLCESY